VSTGSTNREALSDVEIDRKEEVGEREGMGQEGGREGEREVPSVRRSYGEEIDLDGGVGVWGLSLRGERDVDGEGLGIQGKDDIESGLAGGKSSFMLQDERAS